MNQFIELLSGQITRDVRALPERARSHYSSERRVARAGTIEELRQQARRELPRAMFDFVDGAANDEVTASRNRADFSRLAVLPRMLVDVSAVDLSTSVLGTEIAVPIMAAPMGLNGLVHHSGELALARTFHDAGSVYILGSMASYSIEEIAEQAPGPTWFQMYLWRDRGLCETLLERSRAAGHLVLVLTVDVPVGAGRDRDRRNGFGVPPRVTLRSLVEGTLRPRWSAQFIAHPRMSFASLAGHGGPTDPVLINNYIGSQFDPSVTWDDLSWFRERWNGPIVIKGILRAEDARRAVSLGASAISVSNHGGRQLDHAPSTISVLPSIVDAVGDDAEVYIDGGIRRGSDILKALAVGARACLIGRPLMYGLGAGGEAGARRALAILTAELRTALALAGAPSVSALDRSWIRSGHDVGVGEVGLDV